MLALAGLLVLAAAIGGCRASGGVAMAPEDPAVPIDQAMELRQWDEILALYAKGDVVAGPTNELIPYDHEDQRWDAVLDPAHATFNFVAMPVSMILQRPWQDFTYTGVQYPLTYYALPEIMLLAQPTDAEAIATPAEPAPAPAATTPAM